MIFVTRCSPVKLYSRVYIFMHFVLQLERSGLFLPPFLIEKVFLFVLIVSRILDQMTQIRLFFGKSTINANLLVFTMSFCFSDLNDFKDSLIYISNLVPGKWKLPTKTTRNCSVVNLDAIKTVMK